VGGSKLGGRTSTTWEPGASGNPLNRPKPTTWRQFRDRLREASEDAAVELTERMRLARQATERVSHLAARLAEGEDVAAEELRAALELQTSIGDFVRLCDLWLSYAWGKPGMVAPDADIPADLATRPPEEQLFWLEAQHARYGQAIGELRARHRNIAGVSAQSAVKQAQEDAAEALVAERERRH
jgi:hypothetical protein